MVREVYKDRDLYMGRAFLYRCVEYKRQRI